MKTKFLNIILPLLFFIISGISIYYGWHICKETHLEVPGTIIAKSESIRGYRMSRSISSEWWLAIKPDNNSYRNYDVCVSFATFASYNVGSHVSFKVNRYQVDPKETDNYDIGMVLIVLGGMMGLLNIRRLFL